MKQISNKLFSVTTAKFIEEFCKPSHGIPLTNFMHDITFNNGQITMMVSSKDLFLYYYHHKIPTFCTDETGRILANGIYLNKILEEKYQPCSTLLPLMSDMGKNFGQNYGKNSLHIIAREDHCQHLYSLFFDLDENDLTHWVINNGYFLNDFIAQYNAVAKDIVLEAKAVESRITLPTSQTLNVHENTLNGICVIHKFNKMPIYLSKQQSTCFYLLMHGKSAKEIAIEMQLSHRTIEKYIETIRHLLGCSSSKELIVCYSDQVL